MVYDKSVSKTRVVGEGLYIHSNFIVDNVKLININDQELIKDYYYSKISKTPPFPSISETPEDYIDKFIIIDEEVNKIMKEDKNG